MTAVKFLERELRLTQKKERVAQERMDFYGRKLNRPRTKSECKSWCVAYDIRRVAQWEVKYLKELLRRARRSRV